MTELAAPGSAPPEIDETERTAESPSNPATDATGAASGAASTSRGSGDTTRSSGSGGFLRAARTYRVLYLIVVLAFALRLVMVFAVHPSCPVEESMWRSGNGLVNPEPPAGSNCMPLRGDALYIYGQGRMLGEGKGLSDPLRFRTTQEVSAGAARPPGTTAIVALLAQVGVFTPDGTRAVLGFVGALTAGVLGYGAWLLAGKRAGIVTASFAGAYPMFLINDWRMLNETLAAFFTACAVVALYRLWSRPRTRQAVVLGIVLGLSGYARSEAPLLAFAALAPMLVCMRRVPRQQRIKLFGVMAMAALALQAPSYLYNLSRFNQPVVFGNGAGWGLRNGSCDETWNGELIGYLSFRCFDGNLLVATNLYWLDPRTDESDLDDMYMDRATTYMSRNVGRGPVVAAARVGRLWGVYAPVQTTTLDSTIEDRGDKDPWIALYAYYGLLPLALAGGVVLFRNRMPIAPLIGPALIVTAVAAGSFGLPRYRVLADVSLLLAGGIGAALLSRHGLGVLRSRLEPADPAIERARARTEALPPSRARRPVAVAITAGVAITVGVVAVSATAEPAALDRAGADPAIVAACDDLATVDVFAMITDTTGQKYGVALTRLEHLASFGPDESIRMAATDARNFLNQMRTAGVASVLAPGASGPNDGLATFRKALVTLSLYRERTC